MGERERPTKKEPGPRATMLGSSSGSSKELAAEEGLEEAGVSKEEVEDELHKLEEEEEEEALRRRGSDPRWDLRLILMNPRVKKKCGPF